ncbi:MAG: hypothetical protein COB02_16680 [Candidatus Cloacimonadota bacterium]|nr:MAG: hypothetical protein COB02_16680 [Candidatus Cloacimonadota bacterium]
MIKLFFIIFFIQIYFIQASETEIEIHGYLSRGYIKTSKYNFLAENSSTGTSKWGELGINFGYQAHDRLRIGAQILARELGTVGKYKPTLDWAFLDYQLTDWATVRYGKFFTTGSLYNEGRDIDLLRNSILLPNAINSEDFRDISQMKGLSLHGDVNIGDKNSISYNFSKGNVSFDENSAFTSDIQSFFKQNPINLNTAVKLNADNVLAYSLVWNTWIKGLRLGFSSLNLNIGIDAKILPFQISLPSMIINNSKKLKVKSLEYVKNKWSYISEYVTGRLDFIGFGTTQTFISYQNHYHQLIYRLNERYGLGLINEKTHKNSLAGKDLINQYQKDLTFTLRVDISDNWLLKLEYHDLEGTTNLRGVLNPSGQFIPSFNKGENWDMFMAKVTYSF